jgi:hypothetical protein
MDILLITHTHTHTHTHTSIHLAEMIIPLLILHNSIINKKYLVIVAVLYMCKVHVFSMHYFQYLINRFNFDKFC